MWGLEEVTLDEITEMGPPVESVLLLEKNKAPVSLRVNQKEVSPESKMLPL